MPTGLTSDALLHVIKENGLQMKQIANLRLVSRDYKEMVDFVIQNPAIVVTLKPSHHEITVDKIQSLKTSDLSKSARVTLDMDARLANINLKKFLLCEFFSTDQKSINTTKTNKAVESCNLSRLYRHTPMFWLSLALSFHNPCFRLPFTA